MRWVPQASTGHIESLRRTALQQRHVLPMRERILIDSKVHRLGFYEESVGYLHSIREVDGYIQASIGPVIVVLPHELGADLKPLIGSRIGILRTEQDYRLRTFPASKTADAAKSRLINTVRCHA